MTSPETNNHGVPQELLSHLCQAYANLLRRQRTASSAFVNWQDQTRRGHEFLWLGGAFDREILIREGRTIRVPRDSFIFDPIQKMHATGELNPYEREILYGYPYVIGRIDARPIRAPLLSLPVRISREGNGYVVAADDDVVRFNTLPFRAENETGARKQAIERIIESTPHFPLGTHGAETFAETLSRELPDLELAAKLDGSLSNPPSRANSGTFLRLVDQAALFVAPKTSYFLTSDLNTIAEKQEQPVEDTALTPLLTSAGTEPVAEFDAEADDTALIYYPFPSNRAQRRVAMLVDHPETSVVRVEGPPGTGKSLTIANLACHLAATGRTVLITSQKDKALSVVNEKLRELQLPQLPMTLLHHDNDSKAELRSRLDSIEKSRASTEVEREDVQRKTEFAADKDSYYRIRSLYTEALSAENEYIIAERAAESASGLRRLAASFRFKNTRRRLARRAPKATDELAEEASELREQLLQRALGVMSVGLEHSIATARRNARQQLREFSALLRRNERSYRNFSIFDRLKADPERAAMLLKVLPVWIMNPDDVARLFPCEPGLFDVVIIDEASQVDLPSIAPILYRAKKAVISGDTRQMQARRFAFTQELIALEAWQQHGMKEEHYLLHPTKTSLLDLASVRAEEEVLLNEHFRSLPPIIEFSNKRWYGERLRIMTDETRKRFGDPDQPIIELHHVADGRVASESQENRAEAAELVNKLKELLDHPSYSEATFGVICLFEEQVRLVQDMVAEQIDPEQWEDHELVVVNPDGFQGDERDVILYSLSFDSIGMPISALSARQQNQDHIQGMLNVCFTRARDEIHIFHSAPIGKFTFADGSPGALTEWLSHCALVQAQPRQRGRSSRVGRSDSQFEADVVGALRERGYTVTQQYPACGFFIDMVVQRGGVRLAVECDGESYHHDEYGLLKAEDLERQAILERAGWDVLRIPYRRWRECRDHQLGRVDSWFNRVSSDEDGDVDDDAGTIGPNPVPQSNRRAVRVTPYGKAIMQATQEGRHDENEVFRRSLSSLGYRKLGSRIRTHLQDAGRRLQRAGMITIEEGEYFLTEQGRESETYVQQTLASRRRLRDSRAIRPYNRGRASSENARYPITCSRCGRSATVPFNPRAGQPVYCRACYRTRPSTV